MIGIRPFLFTTISVCARVENPTRSFPAQSHASSRINSLAGGKDLSEEYFDFLLVRLRPRSF